MEQGIEKTIFHRWKSGEIDVFKGRITSAEFFESRKSHIPSPATECELTIVGEDEHPIYNTVLHIGYYGRYSS